MLVSCDLSKILNAMQYGHRFQRYHLAWFSSPLKRDWKRVESVVVFCHASLNVRVNGLKEPFTVVGRGHCCVGAPDAVYGIHTHDYAYNYKR